MGRFLEVFDGTAGGHELIHVNEVEHPRAFDACKTNKDLRAFVRARRSYFLSETTSAVWLVGRPTALQDIYTGESEPGGGFSSSRADARS